MSQLGQNWWECVAGSLWVRKTEEKHARSLTGTGSGKELPRPAVVSSGQTIFGIADADTVRAAVSRNMVLEFRSVMLVSRCMGSTLFTFVTRRRARGSRGQLATGHTPEIGRASSARAPPHAAAGVPTPRRSSRTAPPRPLPFSRAPAPPATALRPVPTRNCSDVGNDHRPGRLNRSAAARRL